MADNTTAATGSTIATDDIGGVHYPREKITFGVDGTATDVSGTNPLPITMVSSGGLTAVAGSITAAGTNSAGVASIASTTGSVVASTGLAGNATFHIVTSAFVGTLIFEGSVDAGLNYSPIVAIREDGTGSESSTAISTAAYFIRQYTVALPGLAYFRVRASAFTSGTAAVIIAPGPFLIEPSPSLAASTAQIGTIGELRASTLTVTNTAGAAAAVTATLPAAGAGLFHYITQITITLYSSVARTGAAAPWLVTTTNIPGSPAWTFSTAGAVGTNETQTFEPSTPLKTTTANTATTVVGGAATGGIWRITVAYFTGA